MGGWAGGCQHALQVRQLGVRSSRRIARAEEATADAAREQAVGAGLGGMLAPHLRLGSSAHAHTAVLVLGWTCVTSVLFCMFTYYYLRGNTQAWVESERSLKGLLEKANASLEVRVVSNALDSISTDRRGCVLLRACALMYAQARTREEGPCGSGWRRRLAVRRR